MTTTAAPGPARVATPGPKLPASPAPSATSETTTTSNSRPVQSRPQPGSNPQQKPGAGARRGGRAATSDPLSDRTTAFLIRRILCPQHSDKGKGTPPPIEELLPPLTSRNDVDLQLYALIAIILREFVQNWYNKITPDEAFVAEILQIIAHITRTLEQRLRKVDLESLLFDELPDLLDKHITAYRAAHDPIVHHPLKANPKEIYHSLCPFPALSPVPRPGDPVSIAEQTENEAAYRQLLVHAVLAVLLPTEDLENDCLTALVGQIFSELIIANAVANKLSEPWLIYEVLIIASRTILQRRAIGNEGAPGKPSGKGSSSDGRGVLWIQALLWTILQWCFLATSFLKTIFTILFVSRSAPLRASRISRNQNHVTDQKTGLEPMQPANPSETGPEPVKTPVLAFRCWAVISNLIEMDVRMPWLSGTLSLLQWIAMTGPGRIADVDGRLDRLLSYGMRRYMLDPAGLPPLLRNVRGALFPNNAPGTSTLVAPSSEAELLALKRRCARALWALVPMRGGVGGVAGRLYFNGHLFSPSSASERSSSFEQQAQQDSRTRSGNRRPDASAGASAIAVASPAVTGGDQEGSARRRQLGHGSATAGTSPGPVGAGTLEEGLRTAPRSGGRGGGGGGHSSPAERDKALATQKEIDIGLDAETDEEQAILDEIERGILDVFSDAYCNKHLVYGIVELILVRLLPELADKGVVELLAERLA